MNKFLYLSLSTKRCISNRVKFGSYTNNVSSSDVIEIAVTESGTYLVNGRLLVDDQQDTLSSFIEEVIGDSREQTVVIRADAQATHQAVVTVLDVVGKLGFVEINIATVILPEV